MALIARPVSLTSATWTGAYGHLADTSDGTYLESPSAPVAAQTFLCNLDPIADPGVDTGHVLRVRAKLGTAAGAALELVLVLENSDDGSVVATGTYPRVGNAFVDTVLALTAGEAALVHSYSGLRVRGYGRPCETGYAFVWSPVSGATSYVLQIGTASGQSDVLNMNVGNVTTLTVALTTGTYYAREIPQGAGSATAERQVVVP